MKGRILLGLYILFFIGLISGCSEGLGSEVHLKSSVTESEVHPVDLSTDKNNAIQTEEVTKEVSDTVNSLISNEQFYKAIKQLKPDTVVSEELVHSQVIQQLKVHNNIDYYVAWTEHHTASPHLPMLVIFNRQGEPIFAQDYGKEIISVKYMGEYVLNKGLIEVTSYHFSGSFASQRVNLLMLDGNSIHEVLEFDTLDNSSRCCLNLYIP